MELLNWDYLPVATLFKQPRHVLWKFKCIVAGVLCQQNNVWINCDALCLKAKASYRLWGYHINKKERIKENKLSAASVIDLLVVFDNSLYQDEEYIMEYISKRICFQLVHILLEGGKVSKPSLPVIFN